MPRLFLLARCDERARALVEQLRLHGASSKQLHVIGASDELLSELRAPAGSLEELTNLRRARRYGGALGALLGGALSLIGLFFPEGSLPLPAWLAVLLATICGGSLGFVFGTIMGSAQRHPIYLAHRGELKNGAVLVAVAVDEDDVQEVVAIAREIDEDMPVETRTLTRVARLA